MSLFNEAQLEESIIQLFLEQERYNDRTDDLVFADEIISDVANQLQNCSTKSKTSRNYPKVFPTSR